MRDAIEMVRIQKVGTADGRVGAFSPDGHLFAFVTWRGDLDRNLNVYSLIVVDLRRRGGSQAPRTVLTRDFTGDAGDQSASPIEQLAFLNNRTLVYIGREPGMPQQVFSVDIETRRVEKLTSRATDVREFIADGDGRLRAFSAVAQADADQKRAARMVEDGILLSEQDVLGPAEIVKAYSVLEPHQRSTRQYFLVRSPNDVRQIYDSRPNGSVTDSPMQEDDALRKWGTLTADRQARFALVFPYASTGGTAAKETSGRLASSYGLMDLGTGHVERFLEQPHVPTGSAGGGGSPIWAPDGRSVLVFVMGLPEDAAATAQPPQALQAQWVEVDLASRHVSRLNIPEGWKVMGWGARGASVVLNRDNRFALLPRVAEQWGELEDLGTFEEFNWRWAPATNGEMIVAVAERPGSPPEMVGLDLSERRTTVLTDLNPGLRQRSYAPVERFTWSHKHDPQAFGFLIKPPTYDPRQRYPLVVLLDDGNLKRIEQPYLLDGFMQLSGYAIQPLAAQGFLILYTREPRDTIGRPDECVRMREHIHSAVAQLHRDGLIDPEHIGLSGWSRAGYHTNCIVMDPRNRFAAATQIDGGGFEYLPAFRPYTDDELLRIDVPLLIEAHGPGSLVALSAMADRLEAFGRPAEVLYFQSAPHATVRPQHRLRSLETHLDWWRFWLKEEQDLGPAKAKQAEHWSSLQDKWRQLNSVRLPQGGFDDAPSLAHEPAHEP